MGRNPPESVTDFFVMTPKKPVGGVPTLSSSASIPGIGGLGTSTTSRHESPRTYDSLYTISEHLKTISAGFEKLTKHLCDDGTKEKDGKNIFQVVEELDQFLDDSRVIVICKNPFTRDDVLKILESHTDRLIDRDITVYDSISSAVRDVKPAPDVNCIVSKMSL